MSQKGIYISIKELSFTYDTSKHVYEKNYNLTQTYMGFQN